MKTNNQKGFTLIELMVVIGIIGIITGIAVPSFQRFQAKAKQANAKSEISGIYGMQKAFFTEFGLYHTNLTVIGYNADGVPLTVAGCPDTAAATVAQWPVRYYRTGFPVGTAEPDVPALQPGGAALPCAGAATQIGAKITANALLNANVGEIVGAAINNGVVPATFTVGAAGNIGGQQDDRWTINQNKVMVNTQIGY